MSVFDILKLNAIKVELETATQERDSLRKERDALKKLVPESELYCQLRKAVGTLEQQAQQIKLKNQKMEFDHEKRSEQLREAFKEQNGLISQKIAELEATLEQKKDELVILEETLLLQSYGFYTPRYDFENSEIYKAKLDEIRNQQKAMIKGDKAVFCTQTWTVNDSQKEGERMMKDYVKLVLRSFNNECDASIVKVKFNNVTSIEKRIKKAFDTLNKLGQRMNIVISNEYLKLKLSELYLCYEYEGKKYEEKEEQKRIRAEMREEAKLQKEIEERKAKLQKEVTHFEKARLALNEQLSKAATDSEREMISAEIAGIDKKLGELSIDMKDIEYREQHTRAGYVYVISNVGSFGENVYKIGVTRRLNPQDRVDELGDASVPFHFDVHAMVFSEDAPGLENALHKAFESRRLNKVNLRREFFRVNLAEIEEVLKQNFSKPVEFKKVPEAEQYRQSLQLARSSDQIKA